MGISISKMFSSLIWGKKDIRILILGLVRGPRDSVQPSRLTCMARTTLARPLFYTGSRSVVLAGRIYATSNMNRLAKWSPRYRPSDSTWSMCSQVRSSSSTDSTPRSVQYGNLNFDVWDLGGQTSIRPYWRSYYANTAAVVFVIDSTDIERLEIAADELKSMLNEDELKDAALLVFANKQDQVGTI